MATVEVDLDTRPPNSDVNVPGLGVFKNGTTTTVDERTWRRFKANNPDYDDNHKFVFSTAERATPESEPTPRPTPPPPTPNPRVTTPTNVRETE